MIKKIITGPGIAFLLTSFHCPAQTLISPAEFFNPAFQAQRPGSTADLVLPVPNPAPYVVGPQASLPDADFIWTHSAGGFLQTRLVTPPVLLIPGSEYDLQLATFARTTGTELVFGRDLSLTLDNVNVSVVEDIVTGVTLASTWKSTVTANSLDLQAGSVYRVDFSAEFGDGISAGALTSALFQVSGGGSTFVDESSNLLLELQTGVGDGQFSYLFVPTQDLTQLNFTFGASALAGAGLLAAPGGQNVVAFSNVQVSVVPEPGSMGLLAAGSLLLLRRKRRA